MAKPQADASKSGQSGQSEERDLVFKATLKKLPRRRALLYGSCKTGLSKEPEVS